MVRRIAATMGLTVFAVCVMAGIGAENAFSTIVTRALLAMVVTMVVGLIVGTMAQKMLDENLAAQQKQAAKDEIPQAGTDPQGR